MPWKDDPNALQRDRKKRAEKDAHFLNRKREAQQRYAAKPETKFKEWARREIRKMIEQGKIERGACEKCGKPNGQAHHEDYSKPLDVIWLCSACHGKAHAYKVR